jgi:hypothetical protein
MSFEQLKARQSVIWGLAPWERVAETLADLHDDVVARLSPRAGECWLYPRDRDGRDRPSRGACGARVTELDLGAGPH